MNAIVDTAPLDRALTQVLADWYRCNESWFADTVAALNQSLHSGHACLFLPDWAERVLAPRSALPALDSWRDLLGTLMLAAADEGPLVLEEDRLYLRRYWQFEVELADLLRERLHSTPLPDVARARDLLQRLFPRDAQQASGTNWQQVAAANALLQRFSVVAGGPGTGKTYTVTRLLAVLIECLAQQSPEPLVVRMAAPTGKAAQRLAESVSQAKAALRGLASDTALAAIPDEGRTLHRLLGVIPNSQQFRHDREHPLDIDILVVDEVSMVDLPLMTRLFRALPDHCRVVLLGDPNQLPSVAAGSVLADLAGGEHPGYSSERLQALQELGITLEPMQTGNGDHISLLRQSRRFDGAGGIGRLANAVLAGNTEEGLAALTADDGATRWIDEDTLFTTLTQWIERYYRPLAQAASAAAAFALLERFRILCPTRVGPRGVDAINQRVLARLNPSGAPLFKGQPIMITRNHYELELFNGDIGMVWPDHEGRLIAWFVSRDGLRPIAPSRLPEFETVYAMTIHKTQGSEFDHVAILLPEQATPLLSRELLYTGITRARMRVDVCGGETQWRTAVNQRIERISGLRARLSGPATSV